MPIDADGAMGLAGTMIGAAVAITAVKMTTDMVGNMNSATKCPKGKKWCDKCKTCMGKHSHGKSDYGGELFKVDNWRNL